MKFTEEQRKIIDLKLKEAEERQLRNGNKKYTLEEIIEMFNKQDEDWDLMDKKTGEMQYLSN